MCCLIWIPEWCSGRHNRNTSQSGKINYQHWGLRGPASNRTHQVRWSVVWCEVLWGTVRNFEELWGNLRNCEEMWGCERLWITVRTRDPGWNNCCCWCWDLRPGQVSSVLRKSSQSVTYSLSYHSLPDLHTPPGPAMALTNILILHLL